MSDGNLTYQDLLQIVELIKSASHFSEFHLKMGELELDLKRGANNGSQVAMPFLRKPTTAATVAPPPTPKKEEPETKQRHGHVGGGEVVAGNEEDVAESVASAPVEAAVSSRGAPPVYPPGAVLIKSPMVGTFYRAPEPGAAPFVEIGQLVEATTTVCIIEVMKLINSIPAGHKGILTHILVEDGEPVEFGQLLMVIDPKS
jgi:acetyl-CoA carboxylase biotin carboxyl carrier protein